MNMFPKNPNIQSSILIAIASVILAGIVIGTIFTHPGKGSDDKRIDLAPNRPSATPAASPLPVATSSATSQASTPSPSTPTTTGAAASNPVFYIVVTNDNLTSIAKQFSTTPAQVYQWNLKLIGTNSTTIYPGEKLIVGYK